MTSICVAAIGLAALLGVPLALAQAWASDRVQVMPGLRAAPSVEGAVPGFPNLYESFRSKSCNSNTCTLLLDAVPADALLQATNVSCVAGIPLVDPPEERVGFALFQAPLSDPKPKAFFAVKSKHFYSFNEAVRSFFPGQSRPAVQVGYTPATKIDLSCTLSGTLMR